MVKLSVMHSRYMPTRASPTPIQTSLPTFFFKKRPIMGTIRIYRAVINPALPTVVRSTPICCTTEAMASAAPQQMPPVSSVFLSALVWGFWVMPALSNTKMTGSSTSPPRMERTQMKVKGPTKPAPTLWATKAVPQIKAVNSSIRLPRKREFMLSLSLTGHAKNGHRGPPHARLGVFAYFLAGTISSQ